MVDWFSFTLIGYNLSFTAITKVNNASYTPSLSVLFTFYFAAVLYIGGRGVPYYSDMDPPRKPHL